MSILQTHKSAVQPYQFVTTDDGSPSLRFQLGEGQFSEAMHSLRGAFSETCVIYGRALDMAFANAFPVHALSVGLGLGYNELLTAAHILQRRQQGLPHEFGAGRSYELDENLNRYFSCWLGVKSWDQGAKSDDVSKEVPAEFVAIYDRILNAYAERFKLDASSIKQTLREWIDDGRWQILGTLDASTTFERRSTVLFFDAFSSKSTPTLWTEEFLLQFFSNAADTRCVLSTYACTGALKRSLRASGFTVSILEGFASKRDSTLAIRGAL